MIPKLFNTFLYCTWSIHNSRLQSFSKIEVTPTVQELSRLDNYFCPLFIWRQWRVYMIEFYYWPLAGPQVDDSHEKGQKGLLSFSPFSIIFRTIVKIIGLFPQQYEMLLTLAGKYLILLVILRIFQRVPLRDRSPGWCQHVWPMPQLCATGVVAQHNFANGLWGADAIVIYDGNLEVHFLWSRDVGEVQATNKFHEGGGMGHITHI